MKFIPFLFLLIAFSFPSCTQFNHQNLKRRNSYDYYVSSDANQYFLQPLPEWANFSPSGKCQRKTSIRYLDLPRIRSSLNFTYEEAIQFQYAFNKRIAEVRKGLVKQGLTFENEEKIFYDVTEKIRGGRKPFKAPEYKKIHLIWIDGPVIAKDKMENLKSLLKGTLMDEAPAIFLSLCLNHSEMEEFLKSHDLEKNIFGIIPYEILSIYGEDNRTRPFFFLDLVSFFRDGQDLHLFIPKSDVGSPPIEFSGLEKTNIHTY